MGGAQAASKRYANVSTPNLVIVESSESGFGIFKELEALAGVMATTERLGGSRAQRDLIELAYVHCLLRLGHAEEARRTLRLRRPVLSGAPPVLGLH